MKIFQTFDAVKYYHPDAHMVRLCHSLQEAEIYITGWGESPIGFYFLVWPMAEKFFIVFISEKKGRK